MISKGNHAKFTHLLLLAVSEEAKSWLLGAAFLFVKCIIKQLLASVFVIFRIIKVSVSLDLDYPGYRKILIQWLFIILCNKHFRRLKYANNVSFSSFPKGRSRIGTSLPKNISQCYVSPLSAFSRILFSTFLLFYFSYLLQSERKYRKSLSFLNFK